VVSYKDPDEIFVKKSFAAFYANNTVPLTVFENCLFLRPLQNIIIAMAVVNQNGK